MNRQLDASTYPLWGSRLLERAYRGPEFPSRLRILRILERLAGRRRIIVQGRWGERFAVDQDDLVQRELLYRGAFEPEVVDLLRQHVSREDVLLDIGANVGAASLGIAKSTGARVIAFEPDPLTADVLRLNRALSGLGDEHYFIEQLALGARVEAREFRRAPPSNVGRSGFYLPDTPAEVFTVQVSDLDSWLARCDRGRATIWKLDVEGAELEVLQGAAGALKRHRPPLIVFEEDTRAMPHGPVASLLGSMGYRVRHIHRTHGDTEQRENYAAFLA